MKIFNLVLMLLVVCMGLSANIMASSVNHSSIIITEPSSAPEIKATLNEVRRLERLLKEQHSLLEYAQADLFSLLESASQTLAEILPSHIPQELGSASIRPSYYNYDLSMETPLDWRSNHGNGSSDGYITICLYSYSNVCDYTTHDPQDPGGDSELLRIPFRGRLTLYGEVTQIYKPTDELPDVISLPTNIYLQTKEEVGTTPVGDAHFTHIGNVFADHMTIEYDAFINVTVLRWNIPKSQAVFGESASFNDGDEAHWFMNFAFEFKRSAFRPAFTTLLVVGSIDPYSSFYFSQPMMRIVY